MTTRMDGFEARSFVQKHFETIKVHPVDWTVLWRNPVNGELWKEYLPHAELHGGGPPVFVIITPEEAKAEFGYPE